MRIGPTPGCSTRKATIGSLIQSLLGAEGAAERAQLAAVIAMNSGGESMYAHTIG